jgi:hypothetical protein
MRSRRERLVLRIDTRDQVVLACDLYRAVTGHFNRITVLAGTVGEYRDDRTFGVIAERLVDLVADREFGGHRESSNLQALPLVRLKCGGFVIDKTGYVALPTY